MGEVIWNMDALTSGEKFTMTIDLMHKDWEDSTYFMISKSLQVESIINQVSELSRSSDSLILKNNYLVVYDVNQPDGCNVNEKSSAISKSIFETVEINDNVLECSGYLFKGWKIINSNIKTLNNDYFIMPDEDVTLVAEWSKMTIKKSMSGEVSEYVAPVLQSVTSTYTGEIWKYRQDITKVVFQKEIVDVPGTIEVFDISEQKTGGNKRGYCFEC